MDIFDYAQSKKERDTALSNVSSFPADLYVKEARALAIHLAKKNGSVTSEDVRKIYPIPNGINPNCMGSVMKTKNLRAIGFKQSSLVSSHSRRIFIYEYVA